MNMENYKLLIPGEASPENPQNIRTGWICPDVNRITLFDLLGGCYRSVYGYLVVNRKTYFYQYLIMEMV